MAKGFIQCREHPGEWPIAQVQKLAASYNLSARAHAGHAAITR
jgi:hypothetical protein